MNWNRHIPNTPNPVVLVVNPGPDGFVSGELSARFDSPVEVLDLSRGFGPPESMFAVNPRSGKWPSVRKAHLEKFPTCAACGGTEHLAVHHILPFHLYPERELDPDNLLTLCETPLSSHHWWYGHYGRSWSEANPHAALDAAYSLKRLREATGE